MRALVGEVVFQGCRIEAPPFVADRDLNPVAIESGQLDVGPSHAGVLDDVAQQFAGGLEKECADPLVSRFGLAVGLDLHDQAVLLQHLPPQPLQGRRQAAVVEDRGAELDRDRARSGDALVDHAFRFLNRRLRPLVGRAFSQAAELPFGGDEKLLEVVVQRHRQAAAFAVLDPAQFRNQSAELCGKPPRFGRPLRDAFFESFVEVLEFFPALAEGLLDPLPLGDVAGYVDRADRGSVVAEGGGADPEIALDPFLVDLRRVLPSVGHGLDVRTAVRRGIKPMDALVALAAHALFRAESKPLGHRLVNPDNAVLAVEDDNQVGHAVEGRLPFLLHLQELPFRGLVASRVVGDRHVPRCQNGPRAAGLVLVIAVHLVPNQSSWRERRTYKCVIVPTASLPVPFGRCPNARRVQSSNPHNIPVCWSLFA